MPESQPGRLGDPLRQIADPAQLAGQPDLPDRGHAGWCGRAGRGRGQRDGDREVAGRLGQPRPTHGGDEDIVGVQPNAAVLLEDGEDHGHA